MVMIVAALMLLMSLSLVVIGIIYFVNLGWMVAVAIIIGGLGSSSLALTTIVTGKPEWILLDLILPG